MPNGRPRKCIVTGGAGFIGSHLSERLLDTGHEVDGGICLTEAQLSLKQEKMQVGSGETYSAARVAVTAGGFKYLGGNGHLQWAQLHNLEMESVI